MSQQLSLDDVCRIIDETKQCAGLHVQNIIEQTKRHEDKCGCLETALDQDLEKWQNLGDTFSNEHAFLMYVSLFVLHFLMACVLRDSESEISKFISDMCELLKKRKNELNTARRQGSEMMEKRKVEAIQKLEMLEKQIAGAIHKLRLDPEPQEEQ